jgi:uncharacterized membrane protein
MHLFIFGVIVFLSLFFSLALHSSSHAMALRRRTEKIESFESKNKNSHSLLDSIINGTEDYIFRGFK